ncbi:DEAD/DEAH box helicase family protein [Microbacterium sp. gxy059]|uniref:DEAD/DEAH box helicase family protein n=1 Tax=Microbacterium sp. gxy059 TaxID=2957199 RepID=UPI003D95699F
MHGEGAERPLASWRFEGSWRRSQQTILDAVGDRIDGADPLHLVAPPGAGKTLLGLELARRRGSRTLVLAPTATIRAQWARAGRDLAPAGRRAEGEADAVSEDPRAPGDLTALTYQMLSVIDATRSPYDDLAREEWRRELVDASRDDQAADAWLSDLAEQNIRTYRTGIRRRGRRLRREAVRADPGLLAQGLHENARELIDRLVEHGVTTVVLDECHHLLDHWALVVHCLLARIRERGGTPLVIGLTATLPSAEDSEEFENYSGLLGDVDYELPTPAVVKEGNLAPYRDLAWFVTPTPDEISFLREHSTRLERLVAETLGTPDGRDFLVGLLQPGPEEDGDEARLAAAFRADATIAEAAARMLALTAPEHPLVSLVGRDARRAPDTEQRLRILARYALERILPDPDRAALWESMRRLLADFGFLLTDRGIRRGRDPIDAVLTTTRAKESAIGDILRVELASGDGERVRAAAILDFAVHGHGRQEGAAGALRCFETVAADPDLAELRPVLVTSAHLRIAARDASVLLPRLEDALGVGPLAAEAASATSLEVSVPGVGASRVVEAVSRLVSEGTCRLIVGTRGILGEGWDCRAVNTLIDLSAVATSSATQQLRGRTLRLDPAWPGKVAHNWTVTAVLEPDVGVDGAGDLRRLLRKQDQTWGLLQDGPPAVVRGIAHTLGPDAMRELESLADGDRRASAARISGATVREMIPRAETRQRWGIGEPYVGRSAPRSSSDARAGPGRSSPRSPWRECSRCSSPFSRARRSEPCAWWAASSAPTRRRGCSRAR